MARPKRHPGQTETRERILAAAEEAFAERGFEGARLEAIAGCVGIRRPSLLHHFENKQTLYRAVIDRVFVGLRHTLIEAVDDTGPFIERLDRLIDRFDVFFERRPSAAKLLLREALDNRGEGREVLLASAVPLLTFLEDFVRHAPDGAVDTPREALMALASSRLLRAAAGGWAEPLWGSPHAFSMFARRLFAGAG